MNEHKRGINYEHFYHANRWLLLSCAWYRLYPCYHEQLAQHEHLHDKNVPLQSGTRDKIFIDVANNFL